MLIRFFVRFLYTISGELGGAYIKPGIHNIEMAEDIYLDYLVKTDGWVEREIQIGRRLEEFEVHTI